MLKRAPKTCIEFLDSDMDRWWCRDGDIKAYLKKSIRPGELLLPNMVNVRRQQNFYYVDSPMVSGKFRPFMDMLEDAAREHGYRTLVIVGIMNEFLPAVLSRRGYTLHREDEFSPDYIKVL